MRRRILFLLVLAALIAALPAGANHVPGGFYRGTHSNGGEVTLQLAANGGVQSFRALDLKLAGCDPGFGFTTSPFPFNHEFTLISGSFTLTGSFPTPTTARGTLKLSCSSTTLTWTATLGAAGGPPPPPRPPPPSTNTGYPPSFHGGHNRLVLQRKGAVVNVLAKLRVCNGKPPYRLFVRERLRVGSTVKAEVKFSKALPRGTPHDLNGTPCHDISTSWRVAPKLFGSGFIVITLRVTDAAGRSSPEPQWALRAPKP